MEVSGQLHAPACAHWTGGWVSPRAGLDTVKKRKILTMPGYEPGAFRLYLIVIVTCSPDYCLKFM
jgi:hypothetical protein